MRIKQIISLPKKFHYDWECKKKDCKYVAVELSHTEWDVAKEYCFGLTDKEVAQSLGKPIWTIKTHKRNIFKKLRVNTTHEMVIYCICVFLNIAWNANDVHSKGLTIFL